MDTTSEEESAALFTIEQIPSVPTPINLLSGCDLCEHCTLLRLLLLNRLEHRDGTQYCSMKNKEGERTA